MNQWVADQKAAGKTDAQIKKIVSQYDIRDRYDYDGDGNFDEPDGYIDRFQIIHAGGDQADGDPIYGEDAIWSHRWKAFQCRPLHGGPGGQPRRWRADRQHRHLGGRLHGPARERRDLRRGARVRPRPRPARPLRHRGLGRQPGQLVDADGPEPRVRRGRPGHRHPRRRPRRLGQAPARLARLRDGRGRPGPDHRPRPARVQLGQGPGCRRGPAGQADHDHRCRPRPRGPSSGGAARATTTRPRCPARTWQCLRPARP